MNKYYEASRVLLSLHLTNPYHNIWSYQYRTTSKRVRKICRNVNENSKGFLGCMFNLEKNYIIDTEKMWHARRQKSALFTLALFNL